MKKRKSQLWLGFVCLILGIMISFQFKLINNSQSSITSRKFGDLAKETEVLKQERDDLAKKVEEYQKKVNEYEAAAASTNDTASKMKKELDNLRILSGLTDVEGPGIIITLTPINDVTTNTSAQIFPTHLVDIVNDLNSTGAEAVSINDQRYVGRTQIREAGAAIKINDEKMDPTKQFVIKAIGDPKILDGAFKMPGSVMEELKASGVDVKISEENDIKVLKYDKYLEYKFIKKEGE